MTHENVYLENQTAKNNSELLSVSVQLLIEKLDPLFEDASTVAKAQHDNGLGTTGLRLKILLLDIANRGRQLLNEWASGDETVRLTPGLKKDKARRDRARAFR